MMENINIPRKLNISNPEDRILLLEATVNAPILTSLIEEYLDEYLKMFPETSWQTVYSGGMITVGGPKHSRGYDLHQMLEITKSLNFLKKYSGFNNLLLGFRNPSQIAATMFEVEVAMWCASRKITLSLEFSPPVIVKGHVKKPEFLWHTKIGSLYVECKTGEAIENKSFKLAGRLNEILNEAYKANEPWDRGYRLDLSITKPATNKIENKIKDVVAKASMALRQGDSKGPFKKDEVIGMLRKSEEPPPYEQEVIRSSSIKVGTTPTEITHKNAHTTLTMSLARYRGHATRNLLREAKKQLPEDCSSAIFVRIGGSINARKKAEQLLGLPEYKRTPWVGIWTPGELHVVWRDRQPFDGRLLL